jgi:hypothetical protein
VAIPVVVGAIGSFGGALRKQQDDRERSSDGLAGTLKKRAPRDFFACGKTGMVRLGHCISQMVYRGE